MTANELSAYIGREGKWKVPKIGVTIRVKVVDVRETFGRFELRITPINGSGEAWVQNVKLDPKK